MILDRRISKEYLELAIKNSITEYFVVQRIGVFYVSKVLKLPTYWAD